jgi:hypothetical protein
MTSYDCTYATYNQTNAYIYQTSGYVSGTACNAMNTYVTYTVESTAATTATTDFYGYVDTYGYVGGRISNYGIGSTGVYQVSSYKETEEERAKRLETEKKRQAAEKKARKLLAEMIGRVAFKIYRKRGYHEFVSEFGRRYRLRPGTMIDAMEGNFGDKVDHRLCIHSDYSYGLPPTDQLVQQLLLLSSDEKYVLKTANKHAA